MHLSVEKNKNIQGVPAATQIPRQDTRRGTQRFEFADNRQESTTQRTSSLAMNGSVAQMRKIVDESGRKHYHDGWGAAYQIQDDPTLIASVNTAGKPGVWTAKLGNFNNPREGTYNRACTLGYKNLRGNTYIKHCGPSSQGW